MANVFISYARRDRDRVLALASALEREGLSVWWDPNLVPGKRFREIIARELTAAQSVVVVWTEASIVSDYVQDEAEEARLRGILVPVLLEPVKPPTGFRQVQGADLSQWTGSAQHPDFRMVVTAVRHFVELAEAAASEGVAADPPPQPAAPAPAPALPPAHHHDMGFVERGFDFFARPMVWLSGALAILLLGIFVGSLSGVAAAIELIAGSVALACVHAGVGRTTKSAIAILSLAVGLIVAAGMHSLKGLVAALLVAAAVFATFGFVAFVLKSATTRRARPTSR